MSDVMAVVDRAAARIDQARAGIEARATTPGLLVSGAEFLQAIAAPEYAIRPIVQRQHVVALTGLTGHAKTTTAHMVIAGCLTGRSVGRLRFRSNGHVLALIGENPPNTALQLRGALKRYGVTDSELQRLVVKNGADRLAGITEEIAAEAAKVSDSFVLVIVDTSSSFYSYADENDNVQIRMHATDLRRLTDLPGRPGVLVLCHPVKSAMRENLVPRGGGAFLNEIDSNLTIWNDGEAVTLHHTKMRGPSFEPMMFRLESQDVGLVDDEGVPIMPLVTVPLSESEEVAVDRRRTEDENRVLYAMLHFPSYSIGDWAAECGWRSESGTPAKSKVHRILQSLAQDKLTRRYRGRWVLTESGKKEAAR